MADPIEDHSDPTGDSETAEALSDEAEASGGVGTVVFSALLLALIGLLCAVYAGLGGATIGGLLAHDPAMPLHGLEIGPSGASVHVFWIQTVLGIMLGGAIGGFISLVHLVLAGMLLARVPWSRDLTVALGVLYLPTACLPVGGLLIGLMFSQGAENHLGPFNLPDLFRN